MFLGLRVTLLGITFLLGKGFFGRKAKKKIVMFLPHAICCDGGHFCYSSLDLADFVDSFHIVGCLLFVHIFFNISLSLIPKKKKKKIQMLKETQD